MGQEGDTSVSIAAQPLRGQVVIVTGASRGIGRSIGLALSRAGATVSLAERSERDLVAVEREIEGLGGSASSVPDDISLEEDVAGLVNSTVDRQQRLDLVVNNAAMGILGPLVETSMEQWDLMMAVNVRGPFLLCREAAPCLRQQKVSFIINIASIVGLKGYINQAAYSASKHA